MFVGFPDEEAVDYSVVDSIVGGNHTCCCIVVVVVGTYYYHTDSMFGKMVVEHDFVVELGCMVELDFVIVDSMTTFVER